MAGLLRINPQPEAFIVYPVLPELPTAKNKYPIIMMPEILINL